VITSAVVLERAALHQTRFRTPGVTPDARGVVLGQRGVVLFPSIDRVVAFLRAYGEDSTLDDLVPSLEIRRLVTPLKTREVMLSVASESSYRMDRIAGFAKLAGGLVFTGTSRHFVKYRDAGSPLGYDVGELADDNADVVLYHDAFEQPYAFEREIPLKVTEVESAKFMLWPGYFYYYPAKRELRFCWGQGSTHNLSAVEALTPIAALEGDLSEFRKRAKAQLTEGAKRLVIRQK